MNRDEGSRDRSERGEWIRPELTRLAANEAEFGSGVPLDGDFMFS